jgi:polyvinyl alcohol dehydrogenase (cytochrome)
LKVNWAFGFPNTTTAYSQPTVVDGRVYTGSNDGTVYALDARSGCIYWMYQAKSMVRDAVVIGPGPRAYFGDLESNFYALDANTGKLAWEKKLDNQAFTRITGRKATRRTSLRAHRVAGGLASSGRFRHPR